MWAAGSIEAPLLERKYRLCLVSMLPADWRGAGAATTSHSAAGAKWLRMPTEFAEFAAVL